MRRNRGPPSIPLHQGIPANLTARAQPLLPTLDGLRASKRTGTRGMNREPMIILLSIQDMNGEEELSPSRVDDVREHPEPPTGPSGRTTAHCSCDQYRARRRGRGRDLRAP